MMQDFIEASIEGCKRDVNNAASKEARFWFHHAIGLWGAGQCLHRVLDAINHSLELDDSVPDYWSSRGFFHTILWKASDALSDARKALELDESHAESHLLLAWIAGISESGDSDVAQRHFQLAEKSLARQGIDPVTNDSKPLRQLLRLYALGHLGERAEALRVCRRVLDMWRWPLLYGAALKVAEKLFLDRGAVEEQAACTDALRSLQPSVPLFAAWAYFNRAWQLDRDRCHDRSGASTAAAIECYAFGLHLYQSVPHKSECQQDESFYVRIACLQQSLRLYTETSITIDAGLLRHPCSAGLYTRRAMLHGHYGELIEQCRDLRRAIAITPTPQRFNMLLLVLAERGKFRKMVHEIESNEGPKFDIGQCGDITFLLLYTEAFARSRRFAHAFCASKRLLGLVHDRSNDDMDRKEAFSIRRHVMRHRLRLIQYGRKGKILRLLLKLVEMQHDVSVQFVLRERPCDVSIDHSQKEDVQNAILLEEEEEEGDWSECEADDDDDDEDDDDDDEDEEQQTCYVGQEECDDINLLEEPVDGEGSTLLIRAAIIDASQTCQALLRAGADIEGVDGNGRSALWIAVNRRKWAAVELLVSFGACLEVLDVNRCSPQRAALFDDTEQRLYTTAVMAGRKTLRRRREIYEQRMLLALNHTAGKIDRDVFSCIMAFIGVESYLVINIDMD